MSYVPVSAERKYGINVSETVLSERSELWAFKDGKCSENILDGLVEGIRELKTTNCVVCFIPASTSAKTVTRYCDLSRRLQEKTGVPCSYTAIYKENDSDAGHNSGKKEDPAEDFSFDSSYFFGKTVILVDDVVTRGNTIKSTARRLRDLGASDVVALVVAKTLSIMKTVPPVRQIINLEQYV